MPLTFVPCGVDLSSGFAIVLPSCRLLSSGFGPCGRSSRSSCQPVADLRIDGRILSHTASTLGKLVIVASAARWLHLDTFEVVQHTGAGTWNCSIAVPLLWLRNVCLSLHVNLAIWHQFALRG